MYLPRLAYLPQALEQLSLLENLLANMLEKFSPIKPDIHDLQICRKIASVLESYVALEASRALRILASEKMEKSIYPHLRAISESLLHIKYYAIHPKYAKYYLVSEPFAQHRLASDRIRRSTRFMQMKKNCQDRLAEHPSECLNNIGTSCS